MASSVDLLAECAQQLRSSQFEFEELLGASVASVWQALGRHVARQLTQRKGVSFQQLGKFGFYKAQASVLPAAPVFLLADRFTSTYGVVWRQNRPPAPLTATAEVNMATLGNDAGLGSDQTRHALDAILAFVGKKLQGGESAGRLTLPGVGSFALGGQTLSFTFDSTLLRAITQRAQVEAPPPSAIFRKSSTNAVIDTLRTKASQLDSRSSFETPAMQRSMSVDGGLQATSKSKHHLKPIDHRSTEASYGDDVAATNHRDPDKKHRNGDEAKKEKRRHHRKPRQESNGLSPSDSSDTTELNGRQILPRFLIPEPRVPPAELKTRPAHDQVMQAAFQREVASIEQAKRADDQFHATQATRQRLVQIRDLQVRAERSVARRELNAFLNSQIEEKRSRSRLKSASSDHRELKILPLERETSDETKRAEKQKLNQRLNEQVAAKAALKKDRRTLDQAESAYFISKLKVQDDVDRQELAERKRREKETLLAGWSQQKAIRAQKKSLKVHTL
ncbi:WD_REPEATS_REGION domain-containing protein [Phytophthora pseudosyringae]|uniref:WD_REPEATS_REGION domain-containing protein n=1 Tax=Phytophthora pseudosyringae TaxID=221518 RepID=A0A8T1VPN1_9STRA|nr:WD_REPEATS_REGION domain-containing protein [Phytophthora pseudosyringae]